MSGSLLDLRKTAKAIGEEADRQAGGQAGRLDREDTSIVKVGRHQVSCSHDRKNAK